MSSSDLFINVHEFDGQLINKYTDNTVFSNTKKIELFNILKTNILRNNHIDSQIAIRMIDIIINDLEGNGNIQIENNMDSSDILSSILTNDNHNEILDLLIEQIVDIYKLGTCPSGRVTRFFQIWLILQ